MAADLEDRRDLVLLALPRVRRLISESRTTSDLRSGGEIVARLASEAAIVCQRGVPRWCSWPLPPA